MMARQRIYPCSVVGLPYEGRLAYIQKNVQEGHRLTICLEPDNPVDPKAVAVFHGSRKVGYIPAEKRWVARSLREGDEHKVEVTGFAENEDGELVALDIQITILKDGDVKRRRPASKGQPSMEQIEPPPSPSPAHKPIDWYVSPKTKEEARRGLFARLFHSLFGTH
jgi:hypothetical protein